MSERIIYTYDKVVDPDWFEGGAAEVVYNQARWMARKSNSEVFVVTSNSTPDGRRVYDVGEEYKKGVHFVRLEGIPVKGPVPLDRRMFVPELVKKVDELTNDSPSILHSHFHLIPLQWAVFLAARKNKAFTVFQPHINLPRAYADRDERLFRNQYLQTQFHTELGLSDAVIALTRLERKFIMGSCGRRRNLFVVPNGIDPGSLKRKAKKEYVLERFGLSGDDKIILHVGKLEKRKNSQGLARAFKMVKKKVPNAKLVFVGKRGDAFSETFDFVYRNGLDRDVVFAGFVSDAVRNTLFDLASVFVLLSHFESFGISIAQAGYSGLPIIIPKRGGMQDLVVSGKTGYVVPYETHVASAARRIVELLSDDEKRERMGAASREYIEDNFLWSSSLNRLMAIYDRFSPWGNE